MTERESSEASGGRSVEAPGAESGGVRDRPPRVYLVHRQADSALAESIAAFLREAGIDCWFDGWEILGGDQFVAKMDLGLKQADGGLILLTEQGVGTGTWSSEEFAALMRKVVEERERVPRPFLIPIEAGRAPDMPEFLRTRSPIPAANRDAIADAILRHCGLRGPKAPPLGRIAPQERAALIEIELQRSGDEVSTRLLIAAPQPQQARERGEDRASEADAAQSASTHGGRLSAAEIDALHDELLLRHAVTRDAPEASLALRVDRNERIQRVGERLAGLLGPEGVERLGQALALTSRAGDATVIVRSQDPALLCLPWEALIVGALGPIGILPRTTIVRAVDVDRARPPVEYPGPLRVLVAIAAPDDDLDHRRESQVIVDAVEGLNAYGARVAFADEGGTREALRAQLDAGSHHVLHLCAHGGRGVLQFEGADGSPDPITPSGLAELLLGCRNPPSLVVLSACQSGAIGDADGGGGDAAHRAFAPALIAAGVPAVVAMHGAVSDGYATELARCFYLELARGSDPVPASALARARVAVERERVGAQRRGIESRAAIPEFTTPAAYGAAQAPVTALFDITRPGEPASAAAPLVPIPGLAVRPLGYAVGRRDLARRLRRLVCHADSRGAVIWGQGGVGKSTLATSLAQSLRRDGWIVAAVVGGCAISTIGTAVARAWAEQGDGGRSREDDQRRRSRYESLRRAELRSDDDNLADLRVLLAEERLLLLLDNFESNQFGGRPPSPPPSATSTDPAATASACGVEASPPSESIPSELAKRLGELACAARRGAIVATSRYRVPEIDGWLEHVDAATPLTPIQVRQFVWRLEGLLALKPSDRQSLLERLGGHPRAIEFADTLLRPRHADRAGAVVKEIERRIETLARSTVDALMRDRPADGARTDRAVEWATRLAAEDVQLEALIEAMTPFDRRVLSALALYRRGVPGGASWDVLVAEGPPGELVQLDRSQQLCRIEESIGRLHEMTLVASSGERPRNLDMPNGALQCSRAEWLVHRWTAEWLARRNPPSAAAHGAAAEWWWTRTDRRGAIAWEDAWEALMHWIAAGMWERVDALGESMFWHRAQLGQSVAAIEVAEAVIAARPAADASAFFWRGLVLQEGLSHRRADELLPRAVGLAAEVAAAASAEPGSGALGRAHAAITSLVGDLYRALGQGEAARSAYESALSIRDRRAKSEPDRADYQRDLSVSY
ncbi:MAG TPA: CHAT domain-containing protein, partial [Phycisphaerales bacterium]|nr:CHAT domain-containing protein [Phycisphaerales bacterium]HMP36787.1 CHAT domain-containing protein [Phycisphaerales bacterium]